MNDDAAREKGKMKDERNSEHIRRDSFYRRVLSIPITGSAASTCSAAPNLRVRLLSQQGRKLSRLCLAHSPELSPAPPLGQRVHLRLLWLSPEPVFLLCPRPRPDLPARVVAFELGVRVCVPPVPSPLSLEGGVISDFLAARTVQNGWRNPACAGDTPTPPHPAPQTQEHTRVEPLGGIVRIPPPSTPARSTPPRWSHRPAGPWSGTAEQAMEGHRRLSLSTRGVPKVLTPPPRAHTYTSSDSATHQREATPVA
ncbi:hypothetical protein DFH07DRAFT_1058416 [Mycena maculata]|uniref:Uncharacterized protein n=1 Tax=Mycena maculata TaxID=230809 RepID=A0AAD7NNA9_9AGAR|nr:hypothetical protein DFH07DRAFT_1058416 [Mycena maculata]